MVASSSRDSGEMVSALAERFWRFTVRDPDSGCWEWLGARNRKRGGYGQVHLDDGRMGRAHRIAWELLRGPIPEGLVIDHMCANTGCVNPDHLRVCTHMENTYAPWSNPAAKRRGQQVRCHKGHEYAEVGLYWVNGRRTCAECRRISARDYYRARQSVA